jgi:hypothetical protein
MTTRKCDLGRDQCSLTGLPETCSVQCADSYLPYFSRCGKAVWGAPQPTGSTAAGGQGRDIIIRLSLQKKTATEYDNKIGNLV